MLLFFNSLPLRVFLASFRHVLNMYLYAVNYAWAPFFARLSGSAVERAFHLRASRKKPSSRVFFVARKKKRKINLRELFEGN